MLQFLADVQLPNCAYHIPQLRTTIYYGGYRYLIQDEKLWVEDSTTGLITRLFEQVDVKLLAINTHYRGYLHPHIYLLSTTGVEYLCGQENSVRGPECYSDYLD